MTVWVGGDRVGATLNAARGSGAYLEFKLALQGRLGAALDAERARLRRAVMSAARHAGRESLEELREDVRQANFRKGRGRVANTWHSDVYPKTPRESFNPAVALYSKWPAVIRAFEQGMTIRSRNGLWLAIPTEQAPQRDNRGERATWGRPGRKQGRQFLIRAAEAKYGRLRFVYDRATRNAYLVASVPSRSVKPGARQLGDRREAYTDKRGRARSRLFIDVVVFVLVPQARLPRLLNGEAIRANLRLKWPSRFERHLSIALAASAMATRGRTAQGLAR